VEAVKAGRSIYFASLADIVSTLAKAEREGQLRDVGLVIAAESFRIVKFNSCMGRSIDSHQRRWRAISASSPPHSIQQKRK
jgi:hypothetical protein